MSAAKSIARVFGFLRAIPHGIGFALGKLVLGREKAFISSSERIARIPGQLGIYARQWFYGWTLGRVGRDVHFGFMSLFSKRQATLGERVYIGRMCTIGWADIGDDVMLADGVQILSGARQHGTDREAASGKELKDNEQ